MADDLVLTPGGFRPKSLVHFIEPRQGVAQLETGELARIELQTKKVLNSLARPAQLNFQFAVPGPQGTPPSAKAPAPAGLPNGWQTYAWWDSGGQSITYFATDWVVPPAPGTSSGQTVFLFNGIQNTGNNYGILQPVLQWGGSAAGGGAYWSVANWYVASGGQSFHTNLVRVNPGDKLHGIMTQTGAVGAQCDYNSTFQGVANTTLSISNIAPLHWANETLECYSLTKCSDLPVTNSTTMDAIEIKIGASHPTLQWNRVDAIKNCNQHTDIISNSNPSGRVDLFYR